MKWVTRQRIQVNRTATCWLVRRFLDPEAEFSFVPADRVASMQTGTGATGFDAPGATYPHEDAQGLCSFAALVLQLISRGFPLLTKNDHETAERAAFIYDALYASIKQDQTPT